MRSKSSSSADPTALLKRMAGLCAKSEQCTSDIRNKLYKAGLQAKDREEIIKYLIDNRYLDDRRFARSFANDKVRFSAWGRRKIKMALIAKRIDSELISEALSDIDENEYLEAIKRVADSKKREFDVSDRDQRAKFYRSLLSRGFEPEIINKVI